MAATKKRDTADLEVEPDPGLSGPLMNNHGGTSMSRIDHVMRTDRLRLSDVRYHSELGELRIAGPTAQGPLSDPAALTLAVAQWPRSAPTDRTLTP